jgi:hypothetical protein
LLANKSLWATIGFEEIKEEEGDLKQKEFGRKRTIVGGENCTD